VKMGILNSKCEYRNPKQSFKFRNLNDQNQVYAFFVAIVFSTGEVG
jgi:hypothetical protein